MNFKKKKVSGSILARDCFDVDLEHVLHLRLDAKLGEPPRRSLPLSREPRHSRRPHCRLHRRSRLRVKLETKLLTKIIFFSNQLIDSDYNDVMFDVVIHLRMRIPGQPKEHVAALVQRVLSVVENIGKGKRRWFRRSIISLICKETYPIRMM